MCNRMGARLEPFYSSKRAQKGKGSIEQRGFLEKGTSELDLEGY